MKYNKYFNILTSILVLLFQQVVNSQEPWYFLTEPETGSKEYVARDYIEMFAGFSTAENCDFAASLDETLEYEVKYYDPLDLA